MLTLIVAGRERSGLCDLIDSPYTATRILDLATSHKRRVDPLPQGDGGRHQQAFPT